MKCPRRVVPESRVRSICARNDDVFPGDCLAIPECLVLRAGISSRGERLAKTFDFPEFPGELLHGRAFQFDGAIQSIQIALQGSEFASPVCMRAFKARNGFFLCLDFRVDAAF